MLYTVHWADQFGTTSKTFTVLLDALDWAYMLCQFNVQSFMSIEEGN